MDMNQIKAQWPKIKGEIQKQWGQLTDDDLDIINGEHEKLIGKIMERHKISREAAEQQLNKFGDYLQ